MNTRIALALGIEAFVLAALLTLALDQYAHKRVDRLGGVNGRGYRGGVMRERGDHETRIAVVGGDYAFGWGMAAAETTAGYLSQPGTSTTSVNLGAMGLPAREYATRIEQFRSLAPDVICVYVDLEDSQPGSTMPPFDSAVTYLTGYVPMLPIVLDEKGQLIASRGATLGGAAVSAAGRGLRALDRSLYRWIAPAAVPDARDRTAALGLSFDTALATARVVVVVIPVPLNDRERDQHRTVLDLARTRQAAQPRLGVVDLAAQPRFAAPELRLDGRHYAASGQSLVAQEIGPVIRDLLARYEAK